MSAPPIRRALYLIACGAAPAADVHRLIGPAQQRGWTVCVTATAAATKWLDQGAVATATGMPVRTRYKQPDEPDVHPPPDAVICAPATFNTINKWAAGISDTLATGLLNEALGMDVPIVAVPFVNAPLAAHTAFARSLSILRAAGVTIIDIADAVPAYPRDAGDAALSAFPWREALDALDRGRDERI